MDTSYLLMGTALKIKTFPISRVIQSRNKTRQIFASSSAKTLEKIWREFTTNPICISFSSSVPVLVQPKPKTTTQCCSQYVIRAFPDTSGNIPLLIIFKMCNFVHIIYIRFNITGECTNFSLIVKTVKSVSWSTIIKTKKI